MTLYYSPGACSLAAHIALREAGVPLELIRVDLASKTIAGTGASYLAVNPMGQVPALELEDGTILTEGVAVIQYIADRVPGSRLAAAAGTMERYRLMSLLNFVSTEFHKAFAPLFHPCTPAEYRRMALSDVRALKHVAGILKDGRSYLTGEDFTVADAYLFSVLRLGSHIGIDLGPFPLVTEYMRRINARLAVQQAMEAEQLSRV